uniref:Cullin-9-like n=1 Tax=Salmo trutta TaxID=8032 RepID=A0A673XUZ7_SALTR
MLGERRNGNLLVQLGPTLQAYPEELIRQRRTHDGQTEYLIRWCLSSGVGGSTSGESKTENILMWMSTEDVYANCPTLLGKRKADGQRPLQEAEERPGGDFPADVTFDEVELSDMKDDVKNLVRRARKQMTKKSDFAISITHTIHVLSAYASIGSLVGVFKETGALDLLMELLCNKEQQTRRSAGKMLRALASHDAGSRAYVLLSLSQQDGIEQHMDFDNRYTLLELFAETTSSEEHGISFEGIHLPQIPGKLLFSLVKRYLCVTSLMDKLNTAGVESSSERQDAAGSSSGAGHQPENLRVQREFEFTMAMANLISELVHVMGWDHNRACGEDQEDVPPRRMLRSIFQPRFSASAFPVFTTSSMAAATPPKKTGSGFRTRTDFASRSAYVEYVQDNLKSGMLVRMLEDYEEVSAGDEGDFRYSNDGSPPVQVYWNSLSRTYWVHWHMVEIMAAGTSGQGEKDVQEKASSLTETIKLTAGKRGSPPPGGLYSLPYLAEGLHADGATLSRAEWWEVLFFIKKLEPKQQQEINNILRQSLDEQASAHHSILPSVVTFYILSCRILNKVLDNYQEDLLPWHESIEPCLSSMTTFINDREVVQQLIRFLYRLASLNKDYAVVMCRLGTKEALVKALDKHSVNLLMVTELRDLITDCDKYASLYKKMTTSVLAGCIQMVLGQIEEHRRSHQPINIPFFDVFLHNLCQGSSLELKEDKCWEKVEVSSNHHRANKLTDKNPKTYWESNGCTGSHFINIYMHKGVAIRQLAVLVASEDSSYMPARIVVLGGDDPTNINTELNTVNVPPSTNRIVLLENITRFWSIVQIRIKRCQQGGIDTRVHGFEVLGPKPTFWPVFKEQLCCRTYLFYTTKAHTWCQEILEDKAQLLQLFNKLNSALRHEQMFADRFLPDAEAAEALGRTCWEALITPIVQSITISETQVLSPLSWLLTEYLDNAESARRCKSRAAIFNSRVRRLTHLLVHVDTSRVNTEELKPPIKCSDSIAGIALCWQGVVQRQVKKFLDSTCSLPDFVERYRNMYLHLKNAMEELFGQQTAFMLALRHGFSAALLQLSILTAMHMSERFAQYIDMMIQESGVDSGNVETLNQLQQFLEPMLFLSGLELANTFEHCYRYYLGDRLLGQSKVWLETAVIMQIGTCFPNRFPQQMLKNLSESEELQQEFHLYRLQQLDKTLQDVNEEPSEPDEESEVKVLVLSPRCWAVSSPCYLDNSSRYFPKQLSTYLAEFTDFYSNSQSHSPRRLQWTWLGHAELHYGPCTLYVSTLQMYILLQFNHQQDVSVEALQQATGLSPTVLAHALSPLTAEKGILTTDSPDSNLQFFQKKIPSPELFPLDSLENHSYCYLLPKQTYLNVDEDAACSLERKRNFIYCLIIQIMKAEKEMNIDNLVFRVLDTCQKREVTRSPGSVRFSCSTTDVLSCVMHVISKGYIRRNEDSPHIVEFLPEDPSTPQKGQAHFSFSKAELKNNPSSSNADIRCADDP